MTRLGLNRFYGLEKQKQVFNIIESGSLEIFEIVLMTRQLNYRYIFIVVFMWFLKLREAQLFKHSSRTTLYRTAAIHLHQ